MDIIQSTFVPTAKGEYAKTDVDEVSMIGLEILRAAKILRAMEHAHASEKGAVGVEGEMIDAPMLKQV